MAEAALSEKSATFKRITISIPFFTAIFLDLVSKYSARPKIDLYDQIWEAGLQAVMGISSEELKQCQMTTLPHDAAIPRGDLQALTDLICGE